MCNGANKFFDDLIKVYNAFAKRFGIQQVNLQLELPKMIPMFEIKESISGGTVINVELVQTAMDRFINSGTETTATETTASTATETTASTGDRHLTVNGIDIRIPAGAREPAAATPSTGSGNPGTLRTPDTSMMNYYN